MPEEQAILQFTNVSLAFDDVLALNDVSFQVRPGETRIVVGAAGSGKSVMLKVATGLLRPTSGDVRLFGQDISRLEEEDLYDVRGKVGVLFQEGGLFDSLTIEENVAYPLLNQRSAAAKSAPTDSDEVARRVRDALGFVELEHTLEKFPSELSGGMRRRVGIARATVKDPPLILYDSPTAGLDPITANTIMALIAKARDTRNTTSIIVTHRHQDGDIMANFRYNPGSGQLEPAERGNAARARTTMFMVFREGRLVFEGTQEELDKAQDRYVANFKTRP
jgi:phospholipid/cholesterol/gamma-HCH transport system ATP-binding protein